MTYVQLRPPPPPVLRVPLTDLQGRGSVLLALVTASASTATTTAATFLDHPNSCRRHRPPPPPTAASTPATYPALPPPTPNRYHSPLQPSHHPHCLHRPHRRLPRRHRHHPCPLCPCRCGVRLRQTQRRPSQYQEGRQQQQRRQREEGGKENTPQRTGELRMAKRAWASRVCHCEQAVLSAVAAGAVTWPRA
ncbi:unnamed protein product [Closterium sp. NIES-64]|nr:unnamed protein product [Closterium sp. NIES-64]